MRQVHLSQDGLEEFVTALCLVSRAEVRTDAPRKDLVSEPRRSKSRSIVSLGRDLRPRDRRRQRRRRKRRRDGREHDRPARHGRARRPRRAARLLAAAARRGCRLQHGPPPAARLGAHVARDGRALRGRRLAREVSLGRAVRARLAAPALAKVPRQGKPSSRRIRDRCVDFRR